MAANSFDETQFMSIYKSYRQEAERARYDRIQQNKVNFDAYHNRQDFSYKEKGQSEEFLPKVFIAVEQNTANLVQSLVDWDWFRIYAMPGIPEAAMKIKPGEIHKILAAQLRHAGFMEEMHRLLKLGFLGALMIAKVGGEWKMKPSYQAVSQKQKDGSYKRKLVKQEDKKWQLSIKSVRQQDWRPDPTGANLFDMEDVYLDWFQLKRLAEQPDSGYDMEAVDRVRTMGVNSGPMQEAEKSRETGDNIHNTTFRSRVKVTYVWGTFVDPQGEVLWENCVAAVANDLTVVMPPMANRNWHGENPYCATPLIAVPHSVWGRTPVDSGSVLNIAMNEMFNLILDGGLAAVHGIKQVREGWLEDASQIEDGLAPGTTLRVNNNCPPGATAYERVDTATIPPEALPVYNFLVQEFTSAMMTQDLRMGTAGERQVKATQIVEASNAENAMSQSMAKHIESSFLKSLLMKSWLTICQNFESLDKAELVALLGAERAGAVSQMGPEGLFAETAGQIKFEVFGMSETMGRQHDFTKLQALLQTIASAPILMQNFTQKYDFQKLLTEIMKSLDVPIERLEHDEDQSPQAMQGPQGVVPQTPNAQSQIPQAGAAGNNPNPVQSQAQPGPPGTQPLPPSPASLAGKR